MTTHEYLIRYDCTNGQMDYRGTTTMQAETRSSAEQEFREWFNEEYPAYWITALTVEQVQQEQENNHAS